MVVGICFHGISSKSCGCGNLFRVELWLRESVSSAEESNIFARRLGNKYVLRHSWPAYPDQPACSRMPWQSSIGWLDSWSAGTPLLLQQGYNAIALLDQATVAGICFRGDVCWSIALIYSNRRATFLGLCWPIALQLQLNMCNLQGHTYTYLRLKLFESLARAVSADRIAGMLQQGYTEKYCSHVRLRTILYLQESVSTVDVCWK